MSELLQQKVRANSQWRERERYLDSLPPDLRAYLERCSFVQSPELDELLPWFHFYERRLEVEPCPEDYRYRAFGWFDQLLAEAAELSSTHARVPRVFLA
jgi:hypothetical protein